MSDSPSEYLTKDIDIKDLLLINTANGERIAYNDRKLWFISDEYSYNLDKPAALCILDTQKPLLYEKLKDNDATFYNNNISIWSDLWKKFFNPEKNSRLFCICASNAFVFANR